MSNPNGPNNRPESTLVGSENERDLMAQIVVLQERVQVLGQFKRWAEAQLEADKEAFAKLEAELAESKTQKVFEAAFADKLKEFGTVDRLIEEYSAYKMKCRNLEAELSTVRRNAIEVGVECREQLQQARQQLVDCQKERAKDWQEYE